MHVRTLELSIKDTRLLVKGALETIDDIKSYYDDGRTITAKTGFRFGLLISSYGETLSITLDQRDEMKTDVTVSGEKNVATNIGSNPEKYVLEFLDILETLADYSMVDVINLLDEQTREYTKEVASTEAQADGTSVLAIVVGLILLFTFLSFALI